MGDLRVIFLTVLISFAAFSAGSSHASSPLDVSAKLGGVPVQTHMQIFEDVEGTLTIEDITRGEYAEDFTEPEQAFPNFGYTRSAIWIKLSVENRRDEAVQWLLELAYPYFRLIELYVPDGSGTFEVKRTGNSLPFATRDVGYKDYAFSLKEPAGSSKTYFLRVESDVAIHLELRAWSPGFFGKNVQKKTAFLGIYFGIILVMMFYNFFIYLTVNDRNYLYYVIYLTFMLLSQFAYTGLAFQYAWPDGSNWYLPAVLIFAPATVIWGIIFSRYFLNTPENSPFLDKILKLILAVSSLCIVLVFFLDPGVMESILNAVLVGLFFLLAAGIQSWRRGFRPARYYIIAWTAFLVGIVLLGLKNQGLLESSLLTSWSYLVGSAVEVVLLSLALGDRINIIRMEKEQAQLELLEKEKLVEETLRRSKDELEDKVKERTLQLAAEKEKAKGATRLAEEATRLKDKFVSLVSHDLRSPLGGIFGMLGLLEKNRGIMDEEKKGETIQRLKATCKGLVSMIDRLLDISLLQTGKIQPDKKMLEINGMVAWHIEQLEHLAVEKDIRLVNDLPKGKRFLLDYTLFGEVIRNLLSNALKFCKGGDTIRFFIPEGRPTVIAVEDTGTGIAEDILPNLFKHDVKTTLQGTAGEEGTGLGLPYCRDIMKAHGGSLTVESKDGGGSTFYAGLPELKETILIVDDQQVHRTMIMELIASLVNADLIEVRDGKRALDFLKEFTPIMTITDLQMPVMDGFKLLREIKSNPRTSAVPVMVVTSTFESPDGDQESVRKKVMGLGAGEFATKPIIAEEFLPRFKSMLKASGNKNSP